MCCWEGWDGVVLSYRPFTLTFARRVRGTGLREGVFAFSFAFPHSKLERFSNLPIKRIDYDVIGCMLLKTLWELESKDCRESLSLFHFHSDWSETSLGFLLLVHTDICSTPLFTKFNRLSTLVANSQNLILFRICSIFQPMEQALPSPSDGWHACSRRCQLALDLTARGTGFTHPPLHSPGDCKVVGGFVSLCFSNLLLSWKNLSSVFATFHLVLADRRATAGTTTFVEPCSIQTKKKDTSLGFVGFGGVVCFCFALSLTFHFDTLSNNDNSST